MASKTVSIKEICQLLAGDEQPPLTEMAISQFVKAGMPKAARGQYDPLACMQWRIGQLRKREDQRKVEGEDGKEVSLDQADIRLKTVKAKLEEMTLAEREGRMIPLDLYEQQLTAFTGQVSAALLNLPSRLAGKMEGLNTLERKALLTASVRSCLGTLAAKAGQHESSNDTAAEPTKRVLRTARASSRSARKPRNRK